MKLAYRVIESGDRGQGRRQGQGRRPCSSTDRAGCQSTSWWRSPAAVGLGGRLVVPFGDYATTPSGMEVGGPCWYRSLPGGAGTDPLTLTRAVVQVSDLLDDAGLDRPVLMGWRQGAAVALGVGLHVPARRLRRGGRRRPGVPSRPYFLPVFGWRTGRHLPFSWWRPGRRKTPTVRLPARSSAGGAFGPRHGRTPAVTANQPPAGENEEVVAEAVARFVGATTGRSVTEGSSP